MIKNKKQLITNGITPQQKKVRGDLLDILEEIIKSINPVNIIHENVSLKNDILETKGKKFDLKKYKNIYVVGAGKATYYMASALEDILGNRIKEGLINIPEVLGKKLKYIDINIASHPIPNKSGIEGAIRIADILKKAGSNDLIINLISGGGSALMSLPAEEINFKDLQVISKLLVKSKIPIEGINIVRKHISKIKGGKMAELAYPATIVSMYISDVVGDNLNTIASGPTVSDESTFKDAIDILKKYNIWTKTPLSVKKHLNLGLKDNKLETLKNDNKIFRTNKVFNYIVGGNRQALDRACYKISKLGYNCYVVSDCLEGEVYEVVRDLMSLAIKVKKHNKPIKKPAILIAGGETTLDLKGNGYGGRNQELVMAGVSKIVDGLALVSFATDGVDGQTPEPVAGAMADIETLDNIKNKKIDINKFLKNNDSYKFFKSLDELIKTGYTGVNVGDIVMVCII